MTYRKEVIRLHAFVMKPNVQLHSSVSTRRKLLRIYRTTDGVCPKVGLDTVEKKCLSVQQIENRLSTLSLQTIIISYLFSSKN